MCSLLYELLLAQTLSALLGNTVLRYNLTIGCYLGALGLGAILCGSRPADPVPRLIRVEIGLSVLGGVSVILFYFLDMLHRYFFSLVPAGSWWQPTAGVGFLVATHALIVAIGLLPRPRLQPLDAVQPGVLLARAGAARRRRPRHARRTERVVRRDRRSLAGLAGGGPPIRLLPEQARNFVAAQLANVLDGTVHEFILAMPECRRLGTT
jgi:hypothetical protein